MKLLIQPEDGVFPILKAIQKARKSIDIYVFKLAYKEIEKALKAAVGRGVVVRALIAHVNGSGEKALRALEQRLLAIGATVSRTADELVRYHGKIMIVDGTTLYVLAFNLVHLDIERSRSLGIATRKRALVQEATRLFEADFDRKPYSGGARQFVVSPENSRERLAAFLKGARKELLIYDTGLRDNAMIKILQARVEAGVSLRIIGKIEKGHKGLSAEPFPGKRQHVRCIVRDGRAAFVGSQSLRKLELDARREIGVLVSDPKVVRGIVEVFESDWARTSAGEKQARLEKKEEKKKEEKRKSKGRPAMSGQTEARP
jgi:phosphatidylserine/phosphatidylglycerophosphate/cardiolipin synthase-like enzyme